MAHRCNKTGLLTPLDESEHRSLDGILGVNEQETADLFQELSLGSDASEVPRNRNKSSFQHQYGHVPYGASSHGSERRPNMNVVNLLNGGDSIGSHPWGYFLAVYPSGGYPDPRFGYDRNSNHTSFSHLMNPCSSQEAPSFDQFGYNDHLYSNHGLYGLQFDILLFFCVVS